VATRKALVLVDGEIQQIQAGDTLEGAASSYDVVNLTNGTAGAVPICTPVYISSANSFALSQANASGSAKVLGLVRETSIAAGASGAVQTDGILVASTAQWDAITGQTGGLTAGTKYYLDPATAGRLTAAAPTAAGQYVLPVGTAISTTELEITIGPRILL
jgi:hypothetical protein